MKLTLPWLKDHLTTDAEPKQIGDKLTELGLELDRIEDPGASLASFTVAEVTGVSRHPDAERLSLCQVRTVDGDKQVVCGAPNVRLGMKAIYAPVGSTIPHNGMLLKKAVIRGVESQGMLCSARELEIGDDHEGIIDLGDEPDVGTPAVRALAVEGPVFDIDLTPNRGDCFSVHGIARELAAGGLGELIDDPIEPVPAAFAADYRIHLSFPAGEEKACPVFVGRVFRGVTNGPSPDWLQRRLRAVGLRPISALVDITNLATLDRGRPLHVFDLDKLRGDLTVSLAKGGEQFRALDGTTYELAEGMTVISDDTGVVSLAGVMGGETTGCTETTKNVLLEIALFDPVRTAETGRALGIESDARTRFERGVDPAFVLPAADYAARLILDLCGGEASQPAVAGNVPNEPVSVTFRAAQLNRLTGITLEPDVIGRSLTSLGFQVNRRDSAESVFDLIAPSWRHDIAREADIVEELARLHGFDQIPPVPVTRLNAVNTAVLSPAQRRRSTIRRTLAMRGLHEACTFSFTTDALAERFGGAMARLANPISADLVAMRPSVLPNLVSAVARNQDRGLDRISLFEVANRYEGAKPGEQSLCAAGIRTGPLAQRHWAGTPRHADVFDVKADVMAALAAVGVATDALAVDRDAPSWFHPGRGGRLMLGPKTCLAHFGELHPGLLGDTDVDGRAVAFEIFLDAIPQPRAKPGKARPPMQASAFPPVDRDYAFLMAADVPAEKLLKAVRAADKALVRSVDLFDVYHGQGVPEGQVSMALSVRLQALDRTLEEAEIEAVSGKIIAAAAKTCGAELRH
ncbi:MAG: phenylalanine--tRNA ligase subunit beta [Geminicoccaceae bacterium]